MKMVVELLLRLDKSEKILAILEKKNVVLRAQIC